MREVTSDSMFWFCLVGALLLGLAYIEIRRKLHYNEFLRRREAAEQHGWGTWRWTQDGWVRHCKLCRATQYGGDDDITPDITGPIK